MGNRGQGSQRDSGIIVSPRPAIAIEHRDIDTPVGVALLEFDFVGLVEEIGIEYDRTVGPIPDRHRIRAGFCEEIPDPLAGARAVVLLEKPINQFPLVLDDRRFPLRIRLQCRLDHDRAMTQVRHESRALLRAPLRVRKLPSHQYYSAGRSFTYSPCIISNRRPYDLRWDDFNFNLASS